MPFRFHHPAHRRRAGTRRPLALLAALASSLWVATAATADEHERLPADTPATYRQECAACHAPYPPGLLPARSWQRVMDGLDRHYGVDASVDAATRAQLSAWLQSRAATGRRLREEPPQDRITRSAWFLREHRRVDTAVWSHAGVKSPANCGACHAGAEEGRFNEHDLRLPPGLDPRHLRAWRD